MKLKPILMAAMFISSDVAFADAPRVFLHMQAHAAYSGKWSFLSSLQQPCGAHINFPWRPIDNGTGVYDWSSVEDGIAPWAAAGKKVALGFVGVDEIMDDEFPGNTTALATPGYVMNSGISVVTCPPTTITKSDGTTVVKDVPPTPVYWQPGYANNWKAFIKAAIAKYQGDPRISYIRFGTGAGGESGIMVGASSSSTCIANWNAVGMNYTTWVNYTKSIVDYVASLQPRVPISFAVNDLGYWDKGTLGFAYALGDEAAKYHFNVGNSGYNGVNTAWNTLYQAMRLATMTRMQTANPQLTGNLPTILQDAAKLSMQVYELYPDDYAAAYYPSQGGYGVTLSDQTKAALQSIGIPKSCAVN